MCNCITLIRFYYHRRACSRCNWRKFPHRAIIQARWANLCAAGYLIVLWAGRGACWLAAASASACRASAKSSICATSRDQQSFLQARDLKMIEDVYAPKQSSPRTNARLAARGVQVGGRARGLAAGHAQRAVQRLRGVVARPNRHAPRGHARGDLRAVRDRSIKCAAH